MISAVAFVFGAIGSLFATGATLAERLMISIMPAAIAFVAALLLFTRDRARHSAALHEVRRVLAARDDVADQDFLACFPDIDSTLLRQTRVAIAEFFGVSTEKIHPTDRLHEDLRLGTFDPDFHSFVVYQVLSARMVELRPFTFRTAGMADVGDLAKEIQRVLDRLSKSDRGST